MQLQEDGVVNWNTVAVIAGIIVPMVMAAAGWGVLYERVDDLAKRSERNETTYSSMQSSINTLNITVATLAQSVQSLSNEVKRSEDSRRQ